MKKKSNPFDIGVRRLVKETEYDSELYEVSKMPADELAHKLNIRHGAAIYLKKKLRMLM